MGRILITGLDMFCHHLSANVCQGLEEMTRQGGSRRRHAASLQLTHVGGQACAYTHTHNLKHHIYVTDEYMLYSSLLHTHKHTEQRYILQAYKSLYKFHHDSLEAIVHNQYPAVFDPKPSRQSMTFTVQQL